MSPRLLVGIAALAAACTHPRTSAPSSSAAAPRPSAPSPAAPNAPPDFSYDASAPLDVRMSGSPRVWGEVSIESLTYASPRGGRVTALIATRPTAGATRRPAIVLQHGMGQLDKTELLPDAVALAELGGIALVIDAPDQRPAALRTVDYADHGNDRELWEHAAVDLRRAIDVLAARADVDAARIGFVGHSFGASQGAIVAAVDPRVRAVVLIAPGDLTRAIRESTAEPMVALRARVPPRALAGYLAELAPFDASRFLGRIPATTALLMQFGAYDSGTTEAANRELAAVSTARTEVRTYPTGHFITSVAASRDRAAFLARELAL